MYTQSSLQSKLIFIHLLQVLTQSTEMDINRIQTGLKHVPIISEANNVFCRNLSADVMFGVSKQKWMWALQR